MKPWSQNLLSKRKSLPLFRCG
ncbi:hypothetical protein MTR67_027967 [Solanum verrucosum]|uniref:Uncharacterized protein n=1 Tax=Solanum verrucosum TaxID=315347 RepID=A0AAF0TVD0_SOLVR|nr:hypothetical protein MTR67_027967 [Solanum verrucosum]